MKPFVLLVVLISLFVPSASDGEIAVNIKAEDAYKLVSKVDDLFVLDVRTPFEFQQVRLEGARLIPVDQLKKRINELPKNRPILVYCAVGSRSSQVVNYLARHGYPELYNLYGGIYSWAQKGYPILQGSLRER